MKATRSIITLCILMLALPGSLRTQAAPASPLWLEPIAPGIVFFKQNRPLTGSLMLGGRILSLGAGIYYQGRYANYASAERAARIADLYYGPGLRYRDPYGGGYRSSEGFRREAERSLNLSYYAIASHLILLGIGLYNGILINEEEEVKDRPEFEADSSLKTTGIPARMNYGIAQPGTEGRYSMVEFIIPLDF